MISSKFRPVEAGYEMVRRMTFLGSMTNTVRTYQQYCINVVLFAAVTVYLCNDLVRTVNGRPFASRFVGSRASSMSYSVEILRSGSAICVSEQSESMVSYAFDEVLSLSEIYVRSGTKRLWARPFLPILRCPSPIFRGLPARSQICR